MGAVIIFFSFFRMFFVAENVAEGDAITEVGIDQFRQSSVIGLVIVGFDFDRKRGKIFVIIEQKIDFSNFFEQQI